MKKYFLPMCIVGIIILLTLFAKLSFVKQQAHINQPTYLCDKMSSDCIRKITPGVPKGVCIPGGKCT